MYGYTCIVVTRKYIYKPLRGERLIHKQLRVNKREGTAQTLSLHTHKNQKLSQAFLCEFITMTTEPPQKHTVCSRNERRGRGARQ